MILLPDEIAWVKERMKIYVIKYQEIYDEILDHILTAIEERRAAGNDKNIQPLFQNVVDEHFGGYSGIEELALNQERVHRKSMRDMFFKRLKGNFNWVALAIGSMLMAIAFTLPYATAIHKIFAASVFLLAGSPLIYAYILLSGKIKTIKGKRSLLKGHLLPQVALPLMLVQAFIYLPGLINQALSLPVMMALLLLLTIINISYTQACREVVIKKLGYQ